MDRRSRRASARVLFVADALDAMTTERVYRLHPLSQAEAIADRALRRLAVRPARRRGARRGARRRAEPPAISTSCRTRQPRSRPSAGARRRPTSDEAARERDRQVDLRADDADRDSESDMRGRAEVAQEADVEQACAREQAGENRQREGGQQPGEARAEREREREQRPPIASGAPAVRAPNA